MSDIQKSTDNEWNDFANFIVEQSKNVTAPFNLEALCSEYKKVINTKECSEPIYSKNKESNAVVDDDSPTTSSNIATIGGDVSDDENSTAITSTPKIPVPSSDSCSSSKNDDVEFDAPTNEDNKIAAKTSESTKISKNGDGADPRKVTNSADSASKIQKISTEKSEASANSSAQNEEKMNTKTDLAAPNTKNEKKDLKSFSESGSSSKIDTKEHGKVTADFDSQDRAAREKSIQKCAELIQNDRVAILHCVLYEVLNKKAISDCFKTFSERLGDDVMDYSEFEFWCMRFSNGIFDLDYDRSLETVVPMKVVKIDVLAGKPMNHVLNHFDFKTRMRLRSVSNFFRTQIDGFQTEKWNENAWILVNKYDCRIEMDGISHSYMKPMNDEHIDYGSRLKRLQYLVGSVETFCETEQFLEDALNDFAVILKNPHFGYNEFELTSSFGTYENTKIVLDFMKNLKHKFFAKVISFTCLKEQQLRAFISLFDPSTVEKLDIFYYGVDRKITFIDKIVKLDQWKNLKIVRLQGNFGDVKIDNFLHLVKFEIPRQAIKGNDIRRLKNELISRSQFDTMCLSTEGVYTNWRKIANEFGSNAENGSKDGLPLITNRWYQEGQAALLEIKMSESEMRITRKS